METESYQIRRTIQREQVIADTGTTFGKIKAVIIIIVSVRVSTVSTTLLKNRK